MGDVLEEHYSYLSDGTRLELFRQAVGRAVSPGDSVADVGSGFGVLGLLCLKAGAAHVWGIDETPAIEIARETMVRSGFADRYACIHESSFRAELPRQVDLVICDHVGFFGLDYGIIKAIGDARRRFLKPGGKIVPGQIVLQVAAAQSPEGRKLADGWGAEPVPDEFRWLREYGANSRHARNFNEDEIASTPARLGAVDLHEDCPDLLTFSARLEVARTGELDGLIGWFECELFDGVWMTNSPLSADRIDRAQAFLPFATPLVVADGDIVDLTLSVRHEDTLIAWTARVARTGQSVRQSTWASKILDPRDRVPPAERIPRLDPKGVARRTLLALIDGQASNSEIERKMLEQYPDLFPTAEQVLRFVRAELNRSTR